MYLDRIKRLLSSLDGSRIVFKAHFYLRAMERPISEGLIKKYIKKTDKLLKVERLFSTIGEEEKFKLWFKLSNKYDLVIVAVFSKKHLYIITAWNTIRRWNRQG